MLYYYLFIGFISHIAPFLDYSLYIHVGIQQKAALSLVSHLYRSRWFAFEGNHFFARAGLPWLSSTGRPASSKIK